MISFIIPAYNEEALLIPTLRAIDAAARASGEAHEVIVVDDASIDRTAEIAQQHGARVVRVAHRQIAATRNSGARQANGDFFIFVDADTIVSETVVRAAFRSMRRGAVGGGAGIQFDGQLPIYAQVLTPMLVTMFRILRLAAGCFLFCTRPAFEAVGGFDEALYGSEEITMSRALAQQGRFVVLPECVTTSGRKVRAYTGRELILIMGRMALRGPKAVRQRSGLDIWYGERRADPVLRPKNAGDQQGAK